MKSTFAVAVLSAFVLGLTSQGALAGPIEKACNKSTRDAANRSVCACIQQIADQTLGGADQRRAAKLFNDPDKAHDIWLSQSRADDAFWDRYKVFGSQAETYCAGV